MQFNRFSHQIFLLSESFYLLFLNISSKMLALKQKIIRKKTQQYKDLWNVNTVTLGGLGMLPGFFC